MAGGNLWAMGRCENEKKRWNEWMMPMDMVWTINVEMLTGMITRIKTKTICSSLPFLWKNSLDFFSYVTCVCACCQSDKQTNKQMKMI